MVSQKTVDDLVEEAVDGVDDLLDAESMTALRDLFTDLYTAHPVMRALAAEAGVDAHAGRVVSEELDQRGMPAKPPMDEEAKKSG